MISQGSEEMEVGDIIQITKEDHSWFGCLLMVSEVKSWGVQAFVAIPCRNDRREVNHAYIRLNADEFELVGKAVMIPQGTERQNDVIEGRTEETYYETGKWPKE